MSNTWFTWVVPYISEELVGVIPTYITRDRWILEPFRLFFVILGRCTCGSLDRDEPMISRLLLDIWTTSKNDELFDTFGFVPLAISHGYREVLGYVREKEHDRAIEISMGIKNMTLYERYWDFYVELSEIFDYESAFSDKLCETAIEEEFNVGLSRFPHNSNMLRAAIKKYKSGNSELRNIISRCLRNGNLGMSSIPKLISFRDFDDELIGLKIMMAPGEIAQMHTQALAQGRDDLAARIL